MRCNICGRMNAQIRAIELSTARHSLKAHVDCNGHSEYRAVSPSEIKETQELLKIEKEVGK